MYFVQVNNFDFKVDKAGEALFINEKEINADVRNITSSTWHVINDFRSFNVEILNFNRSEKTAEIKVNNKVYNVTAKDQFDLLLENSGLGNLKPPGITELKAPMPGMVLKTFVIEGMTIKSGDNLFILEAMKMENIIKAAADGKIKSINYKPGDKVEKGAVLIQFL